MNTRLLDVMLYSFSKLTFMSPKVRSLMDEKRLEVGKQRIREALQTYMKKNGITTIHPESIQMEGLAAYVHDKIGSMRCFQDQVIFYNTFRDEVNQYLEKTAV